MANASRTISIDMAALAGPARARWFDPAAGMFIDVPKSPFPNQGTRRFSTPGRNSGGATDWILVLQVIEDTAK
jgi:hypothetical protein